MKILTGTVLAAKMTKSATVEVTHTWTHPKYKKTIKKTKKYVVHNELGAKAGDVVELTEGKPMSKLKTFTITKIIESAKLVEKSKK
jgi:small subunit ribosomal protein S17